jgi:hypothetical protein
VASGFGGSEVVGSLTKCRYECGRDARATEDECDTCYRRERRRELARQAGRAAAHTGRPASDMWVYRVRVATKQGSENFFYVSRKRAVEKRREARLRGTLRFFGRYELVEVIDAVSGRLSA